MDAGMKATVLSLAYQMTIKINMLERFLNNVVSYGECKHDSS